LYYFYYGNWKEGSSYRGVDFVSAQMIWKVHAGVAVLAVVFAVAPNAPFQEKGPSYRRFDFYFSRRAW
jgi:hypothetical protein